jgi:hypothetical protein
MSALSGTFPVPSIGSLGHPEFAWAELEPSSGNFDFSGLDAYVAAAQQHGLVDPITNTAALAFTLSKGTPVWAVADQTKCGASVCTVPPDNLQEWKNFVTALLQRYNGVNAPHIHYYELWSQPTRRVRGPAAMGRCWRSPRLRTPSSIWIATRNY